MENKSVLLQTPGEKTKSKVLIVDDEPIIGNLLEVGLSEAGFEAEYFSGTAKALEGVCQFDPDIIISDTMMPQMDGYELRRRLRQNPETAGIPFIFLTTKSETSEQLEGLRMGTDDYVYKPFKIESLIECMRHVMDRSAKAKSLQNQPYFGGNLAQMSLNDIVQIVELNQKNGALVFSDSDKQMFGKLFFQQGRLVNANKGLLEGEEAFYDLMGQEEGYFEFHEHAEKVAEQITANTTSMLAKGKQMMHDMKRLLAQVPNPDMLLEIKTQKIRPDLTEILGRERLRTILAMIANQQTIGDIIECGVMSRARSASAIMTLVNAGIATFQVPSASWNQEPRTSPPDPHPGPLPVLSPGADQPLPQALESVPWAAHAIEETFLGALKSFERGALTGILEIRDRPVNAAIFFQDGRIVHAYHGNVAAKKALYRIFSEKGGTLKFKLQPISVSESISGTLDFLLEEGGKEIENLRRLKSSTFENTVSINTRILETSSKIDGRPGLKHILSLAREHSRIKDIINASQMTDFQTYRHLFYMVKMGAFMVEAKNSGKVQIVTDSTADLPLDIVRKRNITLVPLSITQDHNVYLDGVDITPQRFYHQIRLSKSFPTISAPDVSDFHEIFRNISPDQDILGLFSSKKISRTYQNAVSAKADNHNDYSRLRQQKGMNQDTCHIEIIDSQLVSLGLGLLVVEAADKIEDGWSMSQVREHVEKLIPKVRVFFVVDTLGYLQQKGQVGKAKAMLGYLLRTRPVLGIWNGEITVIDQVKGVKNAQHRIIEWIYRDLDHPGVPIKVGVMHADVPKWASQMKDMLASRFHCQNVITSHIGPAVGSLCGPGTVAVAFFPCPDEEHIVFKSYGKSV